MLKFGKKRMLVWCFLTVFCMLQMAGSGAEAAQNEPVINARAYFTKVTAAMDALTGYHTTMALNIRSPLANLDVAGTGDFLLKPAMKFRISASGAMTDSSQKQMKFTTQQYTEQTDHTITSYSEWENVWHKYTMPMTEAMPYDLKTFMEMVKTVKIHDQTDTEVTLAVTMDGKRIGEMMLQMVKEGSPEELAQCKAFFSNLGDISFLINTDKKTKYVTNIHMDLSDFTKRSMQGLLNMEMPAEDKKELEALIQEIQVIFQMDNSSFNQIANFEIPAKIRKQAIEVKVPDTLTIEIFNEQESAAKH